MTLETFAYILFFLICAYGAWKLFTIVVLWFQGINRYVKRKSFERYLTILSYQGTKHIANKSGEIYTLCGKSSNDNARFERYKITKVTCNSCMSHMIDSDRSIAIWNT